MHPLVLSIVLGSMSPLMSSGADAPSVSVSYQDLDLTTTKGTRRLKLRLRAAASDMCRDHASRDLESRRLGAACIAAANRSTDASYTAAVEAATSRTSVRLAAK